MSLSATCKVSIAFADGPLVASPTWTDVTAYVRSVRTNRGRSNELDDFQAGTATIVLENTDRRFDPDYASGAYYPNVKVRRQIKVEGVYSATTYPVFRGVVQSWGQDWPVHNRDATCTIQAVDLFGLLATWDLPETAHEMVVRWLSASTWWQLDGDTANDSIGSYQLSYDGNREKVDPIGAAPGASRVVQLVDGLENPNVAAGLFAPGAFTSESAALLVEAGDTSGSVSLIEYTVGLGYTFALYLGSSVATASVSSVNGTPQAATALGSTCITDGRAHHLVIVRSSTSANLYVDGVLEATATNGSMTTSITPSGVTIGSTAAVSPADVTISQVVVVHATALTATEVDILASAALTGWSPQTAGARITRLLDLLGVPSGLYSAATASSSVGAFVGGGDALSYLQSVAHSDQGRLFVDRSGVITFQPKTVDMDGSVAATFADDTTASSVRYSGFGLEYDDRLIYNAVTVTGVETVATTTNTTSQTTYSVRGLNVSTQLPTLYACRDVAEATVARYAAPSTRGKGWKTHPQRALNGVATLGYATVLGRELGDLVSIKRTPPVGTAITQTVSVTSIGHDINIPEAKWDVSFTGAPAYTTGSFRWGTSNWGGTDYWS